MQIFIEIFLSSFDIIQSTLAGEKHSNAKTVKSLFAFIFPLAAFHSRFFAFSRNSYSMQFVCFVSDLKIHF